LNQASKPTAPEDPRSEAAARADLLRSGHEELDRHLAGVRTSLIDSVFKGLVVVALVALPASLFRAHNTGWTTLYSVQLALGVATLTLFALRRHLSERTQAASIVAMFWAVGLSGLIGMGLAGAGIWWLVISSLLVSLLYSIGAGLVVMALAVLAIATVGTLVCLGYLPLPPGSGNFLRNPGSWVSALLGATLMPLLVFRAVAALNASTTSLLRETGAQRERIRELATHDELTGVPSLTLALDRLQQALREIPRSGRKVGVLFIDLDGFKAINDTLGHEAGDSVLVQVARRLRLNLRIEDTVARVGGDEFLVILTAMQGEAETLAVASKLRHAIGEPMHYRDRELGISCSIGAAFADGPARDADEMIRAADAAMYEAKRGGRNQVRIAPG
jgi:diguanylate cyclase (GGDEF)-like protein